MRYNVEGISRQNKLLAGIYGVTSGLSASGPLGLRSTWGNQKYTAPGASVDPYVPLPPFSYRKF